MNRNEVRAALEQLVTQQLLGPVLENESLPVSPSDVYLTGILWPRDTAVGPEDDEAAGTEVAGKDGETVESSVPGYRAIRPCSIGVTFEVSADADVTITTGTTARYEDVAANEDVIDGQGEGGHDGREWHRRTLGYRVRVSSDETQLAWRTHDFDQVDGSPVKDESVALDIRRRPSGPRVVITVTMINTANSHLPREIRDRLQLFQTQLTVSAVRKTGAGAIHARQQYPFADDDEDQLTNLLLYRNVREFAVGHGVAAEWSTEGQETVEEIATRWLPHSRVQGMSPEGHSTLGTLKHRYPDLFAAARLGDASGRKETCAALEAFCEIYGEWIDQKLASQLEKFEGQQRRAADGNMARCRNTLARLHDGVRCLRASDVAWEAFTLANRAMDRQAMFPSKGERRRPLVWRPFQLAYVLLVIPGLVEPTDPNRDTMDLLWFPTGGGKTEAYLALTAFEIFRRRLTSADRRHAGGLDVLMRYTLRLLTIQQFQRAAALIAACELLRREHSERLGDAPISLGLYVGGDSTPNSLEDGELKLADEAAGRAPPSTPRQLLNCPVCGATLPSASYRIDRARRWMEIACRTEGCEIRGVPQAILTVDEAIYAFPPSLLIGTVDKFAQLPRNENVGVLFGAGSAERLGLIIQDELHLISGPLGSMTGLYEACIDMLCTAGGVRPKIIGSTATIGRARRQVRALFDRDVLQFPPPGFDATDSFFAVRDDEGPDRLYLGIATAGRSPKFALQAVIASLMQSIFQIRESGKAPEASVNPYWTCVGYFNSLRELGGAHVLMLDDVRRQTAFLAGRAGVAARPMEEPPLELSSRVPSREIPEILVKLNRSLGGDDLFAGQPPDAVLASNMISVGVDVPRLGVMAVAGQPKSTAEYIQATSRVGRGLPGLVVTLYNFGRPRDLSHFEHFVSYHSALYRGVEATSVTPWAPRARDKALHAVLAAAVRHGVAGMRKDEDAIDFGASTPEVRVILDYLARRADEASDGLEADDARDDLGHVAETWQRRCDEARAAGTRLLYWERRALFGRKAAPHLMRSAEQMRSPGSNAWATPNSLRDVEPSTAFVLRRYARRDA